MIAELSVSWPVCLERFPVITVRPRPSPISTLFPSSRSTRTCFTYVDDVLVAGGWCCGENLSSDVHVFWHTSSGIRRAHALRGAPKGMCTARWASKCVQSTWPAHRASYPRLRLFATQHRPIVEPVVEFLKISVFLKMSVCNSPNVGPVDQWLCEHLMLVL